MLVSLHGSLPAHNFTIERHVILVFKFLLFLKFEQFFFCFALAAAVTAVWVSVGSHAQPNEFIYFSRKTDVLSHSVIQSATLLFGELCDYIIAYISGIESLHEWQFV